jgi:GNAT superfamily N-acetyltransferase
MNCQIVHDSIHRREGWTLSYLLELGGASVGFGSVAIAGPWKDKPTVFEFYLLPEHRSRAFELFEVLLAAGGACFFEVQTSDTLLTVMLHSYGRDIVSEKIVFADRLTTTHPPHGANLRRVTPEEEIRACLEQRQGGGEWLLEIDGAAAAKGGILFHYNRPYGDLYMEVAEPFRKRGLGSYLVQELKRECYGFGAIPCARCHPTNIASRRTLQRAGFVPFAHILTGTIAAA